MKTHRIYHKIMCARLQYQRVVISDHLRIRQARLPEFGKTRHHGGRGKGFVNHRQTLRDLIRRQFVQEQHRRARRAQAVAEQGMTVGERCLGHGKETRVHVAAFQTAVRLIYPSRCTLCGVTVDSDFGLCGPCWRDTPFISGLVCDVCGVPLPGESGAQAEFCDECLVNARPWTRGRAAMRYHENGRRLVLALKHGDRHDVVRPAAKWLAQSAQPLLGSDTLIAPVPLHWTRMLSRRFNQSALLAQALARETGHPCCPDLLVRTKRTKPLVGMGVTARNEMLMDAIKVNSRHLRCIMGRDILLIDDVMTSGATLSVATQACFSSAA